MSRNPYRSLPPTSFWKRAVVAPKPSELDPVVSAVFRITPEEKVATAGSCFAQHIARHLKKSGFCYFVTEDAHPIMRPETAAEYNYGTYSARYANLYTTRQLVQLFRRAYGTFQPGEDIWRDPKGRFIDPFRPEIQPGGFATEAEYWADRRQHLAAVRRMFEELDVFVFTLGLTECYRSRDDGAVFPVCPGVSGGEFDASRHEFHNFDVNEVLADLIEFIDLLRGVNPEARILLTVSPVPLVATAEPRHVLVSTTYSKSVLRVAAEMAAAARPDVAYFPSFEIITGSYNRGAYFDADLRSVKEEGVEHVMRTFLCHYTDGAQALAAPAGGEADAAAASHMERMSELVKVNCEEEALERAVS